MVRERGSDRLSTKSPELWFGAESSTGEAAAYAFLAGAGGGIWMIGGRVSELSPARFTIMSVMR